jgi:hypothetical protein
MKNEALQRRYKGELREQKDILALMEVGNLTTGQRTPEKRSGSIQLPARSLRPREPWRLLEDILAGK